MKYTALLVREPGGGYVVRVPALRGCVTHEDNLGGPAENAREAIVAHARSLAWPLAPAPQRRASSGCSSTSRSRSSSV